ncbi:hypothetical protein ACH0B5_04790 [Ureibacillus sp. 179-F W5.1 NHS]|uniref:hypothetical protein n=1 Tax=Ureibacillus sp. 179-F W5.1 NHS TaxID=3374297 RepID=UPI0038797C46
MRKVKIWWIIGYGLFLSFLILNIRLVFSEDSQISRSYYISEYERATSNTERAYIEKDALIVPKEEIHITANAEALSQISVQPGQKILMDEEIAAYKTEEAAKERKKMEAERMAYERELMTLEEIVAKLEVEEFLDEPTSNFDTEEIGDEFTFTIETQILKESPIEAIAIVESRIAEVQRNIDIIDEQMNELTVSNVLSSPVDGMIGDVIEENGSVTFILYPNDKNLLTYLSEKEWQQINENQNVELDPLLVGENIGQAGGAEELELAAEGEKELLGVIVEKQNIPAIKSIWYKEMEKVVKLPQPTAYELRIDLDEQIINKPIASLTKAKIIIDEALNAHRLKKEWVHTDNTSNSSIGEFVYILDEEGKINLSPVHLEFHDHGTTVFTSSIEDGTVILNDKERKLYSRSFFPFPTEWPDKELLSTFTWEDYFKYLFLY